MGYYAGKDASVTVAGNAVGFSHWTVNLKADVLNKTIFGNNSKTKMSGLKDGQLSLRGPYNLGSMPVSQGATITVALKLAANTVATGDAIVSNIRVVADANDGSNPVMLEVEAELTGDWTVTIT